MKRKFVKKCMQVCIVGSMLALFGIAFLSVAQQKSGLADSRVPLVQTDLAESGKKPAAILFVGDLMFDRYIRQTMEKRGQDFILQKAQAILQGNDLVVGNLEGPITSNASVSVASKMGERNNYIFTFDPSIGNLLTKEHIGLVSLGNNHITNFGSEGIAQTRSALAASAVRSFGDPENGGRDVAVEKIAGRTIAFVNYNQFASGSGETALDAVRSAKALASDIVVVYAHWGTEFVLEPEEVIKNLAHAFIDAGADAVIGTHPHVIQSKETYQGKMIYYSLGNFVFDQYFDTNTKKGLAVKMVIDEHAAIKFEEFFVQMQPNGQTVAER